MAEFGRIDILVNNAATNPAMGPIVDTEESVYDQIMDTNLKGYFVMSQLVGRVMRDQKEGVIVNISSAGGVEPRRRTWPILRQQGRDQHVNKSDGARDGSVQCPGKRHCPANREDRFQQGALVQ